MGRLRSKRKLKDCDPFNAKTGGRVSRKSTARNGGTLNKAPKGGDVVGDKAAARFAKLLAMAGNSKKGTKRSREDKGRAGEERAKFRNTSQAADPAPPAADSEPPAGAHGVSVEEDDWEPSSGSGGLVAAPLAAGGGASSTQQEAHEHNDARDGMLPGETFAQFASRLERDGRARLTAKRREDSTSMRASRKSYLARKAEVKLDKKGAAAFAARRARLRTEGREGYASDEEALGRSLKDEVVFGERVEAPPKLGVKPRHAGTARTSAGERMMHLLEAGKWGGGAPAPAPAPDARASAISEYRNMRARQAEMKRVQGAVKKGKVKKGQKPTSAPRLGSSAF